MNDRVWESFYGSLAALALAMVFVAMIWRPVIRPEIVSAGEDAGKGAARGLLGI